MSLVLLLQVEWILNSRYKSKNKEKKKDNPNW